MNDKNTGLAPYQGHKAGRPSPRTVLALIQKKCELRAMRHLNQAQTQELLSLMAVESSDVATGPDIVRVQEEAVQAAQGIQPLDVRLTRPATKALKDEVIRRLSTGYCPPTPLLVAEAVRAQFEREIIT